MSQYKTLLPVVVLAMGCATTRVARAEEAALRFRGSEAVVSPVDVWTGDGWYSIGESPLIHAKVQFFDVTFDKSDGDTWIGSESGVFDFGDGDEFQVKCHFVLEYVTNPAGVSRIFSSVQYRRRQGDISERRRYGDVYRLLRAGDGLSWTNARRRDLVLHW